MAPPSSRRRRDVSDSEDTDDEEMAPSTAQRQNRQINTNSEANGDARGEDEYQPGAIVRVKLLNFVTYEDAVFYPGPNLNMVIGPNGTGKSSLVCAICIGLGYNTVNLGRAAKFGEFVKHGKDDAYIEIELQGRPEDGENLVIKVRVSRDGDKRKWWLNGEETSLKTVQGLVKSLGIQVDNLCQFLPQDRVSEFAGLSPIELLHETQRAAAPPQMLAWHDELKALRKEQKVVEHALEQDEENLQVQEERNEGLRGDVERLQERQEIQERIVLLEKSFPFVEYREARNEFQNSKVRHKDAQTSLRNLEAEVAPTLEAVNEKQAYAETIGRVVDARQKEVKTAERSALTFQARIDEMDSKLKACEQQRIAEAESDKSRVQQINSIRRKIRDLEAQQMNAPPVFEPAEWNGKIRAEEHRLRELDTELRQLQEQIQNMRNEGREIQRQTSNVTDELKAMETQDGQNVNKLRTFAPESAKAWEWITHNKRKFEKEVFGPPLISCSVKDARCSDLLESLLMKNDFMTFTTQTSEDFKTLSDALYGELKLADITIRTSRQPLNHNRIMSHEQLNALGLDGWAIDYLHGPDPVLAMLASNCRLDRTAIALRDINDAQYNAICETPIGRFAAGSSLYTITRRPEYGPSATSTQTKAIRRATYWTDAPADTSAKRALETRKKELGERFDQLKANVEAPAKREEEIKAEKVEVVRKIDHLKGGKNNAQTAHGLFIGIPAKLDVQRDLERQKREAAAQHKQRMAALQREIDEYTLRKNMLAFDYAEAVKAIGSAHFSLLEAKLRHLEAQSDVSALKEKNRAIAQRLEAARQELVQAAHHKTVTKATAERSLDKCRQILAENDNDEKDNEYFNNLAQDLTVEQLRQDIDAEKAKLDYIQVDDPGALRQFDERKKAIERLQAKIATNTVKLEEVNARITQVREDWEPQLDALIAEISAAFAHNFERIGCAGEVGVHKDADFDLWSIEIRVKFRENETLQLLDQHRQSGGERSVSTIFYLMALQSLARSPFRVVDEINQGMDPRNERMVHERMVEIACKEHTSQYFLITPKLLTGLKYDRRMKVLCIASGEYMPADHAGLDVRRVIELRRRQREVLMV